MNRQSAIALGVAVLVGLLAVYLANTFFVGVEAQHAPTEKDVKVTKVVVASQAIEFGSPLTNTNLALVDWPTKSMPAGAFTNVREAMTNRIALQQIAAGEPILKSRVSGSDGRATLSVRLGPDRYAVSIPLNDVSGVAGFIRPGDLVDVLLTRQIPGDTAQGMDRMNQVVMQAVPVLGIDQVLDKNKTDPSLGKTATLDVDLRGAQKLALARELGNLSLALRNMTGAPTALAAAVTARDLGGPAMAFRRPVAYPAPSAASAQPANTLPRIPAPPRYFGSTMTIFRKGVATQYEVNHAF